MSKKHKNSVKGGGGSVSNGNKGVEIWKKFCSHKGATPVWIFGEKGLVLGGSRYEMEDYYRPVDLFLNLCGTSLKPAYDLNRWAIAQLPRRMFPNIRRANPAMITIDWPDGGIPKVGRAFWEDIVRYIQRGQKTLGVYCMGGHGRTGTALCAIGIVGGVKGDVLKEVRKIYCNEAVETSSQIKYLEALGLKTECKPSHDSRIYTGVSSNGNYGKSEYTTWHDVKKDPATSQALSGTRWDPVTQRFEWKKDAAGNVVKTEKEKERLVNEIINSGDDLLLS